MSNFGTIVVCDFEYEVALGVDVDQMLEGGARYCDKRPMAQQMWTTMMDALQAINAVPATKEKAA